jgi:hypothetical protein
LSNALKALGWVNRGRWPDRVNAFAEMTSYSREQRGHLQGRFAVVERGAGRGAVDVDHDDDHLPLKKAANDRLLGETVGREGVET